MTNHESKVMAWITRQYAGPYESEAEMLEKTKDLAHLLKALVVREESEVRGRSDLLLCYQGAFVALELKDKTGRPSPHQLKFITDVRKAGGRAAVVDNLYDAFDHIIGRAKTQ